MSRSRKAGELKSGKGRPWTVVDEWMASEKAERPVKKILKALLGNLKQKHNLKVPRAQERILIRNAACFITAGLAVEWRRG